jgi:hypothetical protein
MTVVCTDVEAWRLLVGAGMRVVVILEDAAALAGAVAGLPGAATFGVFVGDPGDPACVAAALEMAAEQFGQGAATPDVITSIREAEVVLGGAERPARGG